MSGKPSCLPPVTLGVTDGIADDLPLAYVEHLEVQNMSSAIRKRLEEREEGFTLIELLVVVIIIGILAAIAIPVFLNQRQRGWAGAAESDSRNAAIAAETNFTQNGAYVDGTAQRTLAGVETAGTGSLVGFKPSAGVATVFDTDGNVYCIISRHTNSPNTDYAYLPSDGALNNVASGACVTLNTAVPGPTG